MYKMAVIPPEGNIFFLWFVKMLRTEYIVRNRAFANLNSIIKLSNRLDREKIKFEIVIYD